MSNSLRPLLSILIATVDERKDKFNSLMEEFIIQKTKLYPFSDLVEIHYLSDNKEMSIGAKRNKLLKMATGRFIVFFDDDDMPYSYYIYNIVKSIILNPDIDCIGMIIEMTTDGDNYKKCFHSLQNKEWRDGKEGEQYNYYRNITHFNPVRRDLAIQVGFPDMRFGEDKEYSDKISRLCAVEHLIPVPMFHYQYTTGQSHNEKYGIK